MHTSNNAWGNCLYMKYKRIDLKWYQKFWNIITGHKDRNWKWVPVERAERINYVK